MFYLGIVLRNTIGVSTIPSEVALIDVYWFFSLLQQGVLIALLWSSKGVLNGTLLEYQEILNSTFLY